MYIVIHRATAKNCKKRRLNNTTDKIEHKSFKQHKRREAGN